MPHTYEIIALLQPTSPFLSYTVIDLCLQMLLSNPDANSVQTVCPIPHNYHAYNQRIKDDNGDVTFVFSTARNRMYNKQLKPKFYSFGNFVATRVDALGDGVFARPSIGFEIQPDRAVDIDTQFELDLVNGDIEW